MDLKLQNKVAFITGGSHGIGRAIVLALDREGCLISFCGKTPQHIREVANKLNKTHLVGQTDVMKKEQLFSILNDTIKIFGKIDILINNVGGSGRWGTEIPHNTEEKVWDEFYYKNVDVARQCSMFVLPYMLKQKWGRIVTISSITGLKKKGRPWFSIANISKITLMKSLSLIPEYSRSNITFNTVIPGAVMIPDTGWDKLRKENIEEYDRFVDTLPLGRLIEPGEVANVVAFLCSDLASGINGEYIRVDGSESEAI